MKLDEIKKKLRTIIPEVEERFKVQSLDLFGSYVRGEEGSGSDLDILVEFHKTIDLFDFVALEDFLGDALGVKVDLVMKDTLKPRIKDRILREAVSV